MEPAKIYISHHRAANFLRERTLWVISSTTLKRGAQTIGTAFRVTGEAKALEAVLSTVLNATLITAQHRYAPELNRSEILFMTLAETERRAVFKETDQ